MTLPVRSLRRASILLLSIGAAAASVSDVMASRQHLDLLAYAYQAAQDCDDMELNEQRAWEYLTAAEVVVTKQHASIGEMFSGLAHDGAPNCARAWEDFGDNGYVVRGLLQRPKLK